MYNIRLHTHARPQDEKGERGKQRERGGEVVHVGGAGGGGIIKKTANIMHSYCFILNITP